MQNREWTAEFSRGTKHSAPGATEDGLPGCFNFAIFDQYPITDSQAFDT
jgi:hypothetical protein